MDLVNLRGSAMMRAVGIFVVLGLAAAAFVAFLLMMRNATLLFEARVEKGRIVRLRGRAPKRLVRDFNDVLRVRPVPKATLRVCSSDGKAEMHIKGDVREGESQRLRNVLGTFAVAQIRAEPYRTE